MAGDCNGFGVSAADVVELEAGFAPLEAAFTAPSFCRRILGRLSAPEFRELYADGGTATIASIARCDASQAFSRRSQGSNCAGHEHDSTTRPRNLVESEMLHPVLWSHYTVE